jgi:hypothetical protein
VSVFYLVGSSGQVLDGEVPKTTWHSFQWLLHSMLPSGGASGSPDGPMRLLLQSMVQDPPTLWVIRFDPGGRHHFATWWIAMRKRVGLAQRFVVACLSRFNGMVEPSGPSPKRRLS